VEFDPCSAAGVMGVSSKVEAGKHWLIRAEECRRLAQTFRDAQTRERMLQVAEDYARMALLSVGQVQASIRAEALQDE
jgi:hypothetical protein